MKEAEYDSQKLRNKRSQQKVSSKIHMLLIVIIQGHPKPLVNPINIPTATSESANSESAAPQSPPTIMPTTTLISDVDLLRCSRHIHGNISILAGPLGITSTNLQEITRDYEDVETQAYWVLKKWQESVSHNVQHQDLHDKLQVLGFNDAAERYYCLYINNNVIIYYL